MDVVVLWYTSSLLLFFDSLRFGRLCRSLLFLLFGFFFHYGFYFLFFSRDSKSAPGISRSTDQGQVFSSGLENRLRTSNHGLDVACAECSFKAYTSSQFRSVIENDSSLVLLLNNAANDFKNVTIALVKESLGEVRERACDVPQVYNHDFVAPDEISDAVKKVSHGSGTFQPASAAKFHLKRRRVFCQCEHTFVAFFAPDQVWDASEDRLGRRIVWMQGKFHTQLLCGGKDCRGSTSCCPRVLLR